MRLSGASLNIFVSLYQGDIVGTMEFHILYRAAGALVVSRDSMRLLLATSSSSSCVVWRVETGRRG